MKILYMFTAHTDTYYFVGDKKKYFPHFITYWNYEWGKKNSVEMPVWENRSIDKISIIHPKILLSIHPV